MAPFEAVISDYFVEIGDVLKKGDPVAEMIDLEPILVKAFVSEKYRSSIQQGMTAHGLLIDGTKRAGKIRYISPVAKKSTRTFKVELEISNEGNKIAEGTTAELMIKAPRAMPNGRKGRKIWLPSASIEGIGYSFSSAVMMVAC